MPVPQEIHPKADKSEESYARCTLPVVGADGIPSR
jgi:hypothetical protein